MPLTLVLGCATASATSSVVIEAESGSLSPSTSGVLFTDASASGGSSNNAFNIYANGTLNVTGSGAVNRVVVRARGDQCNGAPVFQLSIDGSAVGSPVTVPDTAWTDYTVALPSRLASSGSHAVAVAYTNDSKTSTCDRNLRVDTVSLVAVTPVVSSLSPAGGSTTGGNTVTITGIDFAPGAAVKFGTVSSTSVTYVSPTQLTAVAPAGAAGSVDVRVTTGGTTSPAWALDKYAYGTIWYAPTYNANTTDVGSVTSWDEEEAAAANLSLTTSVGGLGTKPTGALVASIPHGVKTTTGTYSAYRSEVKLDPSNTASQYPKAGTDGVTWIDFQVYVPTTTLIAKPNTTQNFWSDVFQWKGLGSGGPSVAIGINPSNSHFIIDSDTDVATGQPDLGAVTPGTWQQITLGVRFAPDSTGWVEGWLDGQNTLPRTSRQTQEVLANQTGNPVYPKEGLYESSAWGDTYDRTVYHGPIRIASSREVAIAR